MTLRQMEINNRLFQLGVSKQHLDGSQIGASLQHVGCVGMSKDVRRDALVDPSSVRSLSGCSPRHLFRDRDVGAPMIHRAAEEPCLGLHPSALLTQRLEQIVTERYVAISSALAFPDMDHHPFAIN